MLKNRAFSIRFLTIRLNKRRCEMGKIVVKKVITRKPGHLYYIDAHGNVCEAKMARGGRKKKAAKKKKKRR